MEDLVLPIDAKLISISAVQGPFFLNREGRLSRLIEVSADRTRVTAYVDFGAQVKGETLDYRFSGGFKDCVDLPMTKVDVMCHELIRLSAQEAPIGSLYPGDSGFVLVAKSWNEGQEKMYINLATGEFALHASPSVVTVVKRYAIRGWRDDQIVLKFTAAV